MCSLFCRSCTLQELSEKAVDARLRRMCEVKKRTGKCMVDDWIREEWEKGGSHREVLLLSLLESLKANGTANNKETRNKVKAFMQVTCQSTCVRSSMIQTCIT